MNMNSRLECKSKRYLSERKQVSNCSSTEKRKVLYIKHTFPLVLQFLRLSQERNVKQNPGSKNVQTASAKLHESYRY
jgi:hypothetical protein